MQCPKFHPHMKTLENTIARERWVKMVIEKQSHVNITFCRARGQKPIQVCGAVVDGYVQGPYLMFVIETLQPTCRESDIVTECGATMNINVPSV